MGGIYKRLTKPTGQKRCGYCMRQINENCTLILTGKHQLVMSFMVARVSMCSNMQQMEAYHPVNAVHADSTENHAYQPLHARVYPLTMSIKMSSIAYHDVHPISIKMSRIAYHVHKDVSYSGESLVPRFHP